MKTKTNQEIFNEVMKGKCAFDINDYEDFKARGGMRAFIKTLVLMALEIKDEQACQEKIELVDDLFWRVEDIRKDLQKEHAWGLSQWCTPVVNLKLIEEKLTQLKR